MELKTRKYYLLFCALEAIAINNFLLNSGILSKIILIILFGRILLTRHWKLIGGCIVTAIFWWGFQIQYNSVFFSQKVEPKKGSVMKRFMHMLIK
ncbi:hypothetical protein ACWCL1_02585 [Ligilactobacillus sp. LYQ135]